MNKRKLEINEVKKIALRGKKQKTIITKYEVALSFFKQKQQKNSKIFIINFQPLIVDLLDQLTNVQIAYKLENQIKDDIQSIEVTDEQVKFEGPSLKYISKQLPIDEIMKCISIKKDVSSKTVSLQIMKTKLMLFFKHIRGIYSQFCFCVGEKIIVESYDVRAFYEQFKLQWAKSNERGRMQSIQKIEKLVCRSLYFVGALVENNIFSEIQEQQRKKKQENTDLGTKSQKKRNVKGINQQVSSTYSFGSTDMLSNFSYGLRSQQSNEQDYFKSGYSQKSQKIIRKQRCFLWQRADIKSLKIKLHAQPPNFPVQQQTRYEINLLSNDVENILIEQAFKIQKLKDACDRNRFDPSNPYPYQAYMNYYNPSYYQHSNQHPNNYPNNYPIYQQQVQSYQNSHIPVQQNNVSEDPELYNRRTLIFANLVQTRKTHSRLGGNKYS